VLKIRLRREGSRNRPFYRVVVSDSRRTPTGPTVDTIGLYDPKVDPPAVRLDLESYQRWVDQGAHPSDTVRSLVRRLRAEPDDAAS
jgi:small subunit ribosomal protein S16